MKRVLKAFTLVEVMCVVTILAIVSVVAVPSISGYIDRYNQRVCKSAVSDMLEDIEVNCVKNRIMFDSDYKNVNNIITETIKSDYTDGILDTPLYDNGSFSVSTDAVCPQNEACIIRWSVAPDGITEPAYADVRISVECEEHGTVFSEAFRIAYKTVPGETGRRQINDFPQWVSVYETFVEDLHQFFTYKVSRVNGEVVVGSGKGFTYDGSVNYNGKLITSPVFSWNTVSGYYGQDFCTDEYIGNNKINFYAFAQMLRQSSSLYSDGYIIDEDISMFDIELPDVGTNIKNWDAPKNNIVSESTGKSYGYSNEWELISVFDQEVFFSDIAGYKQYIMLNGAESPVAVYRKGNLDNEVFLTDEYFYYVGSYGWSEQIGKQAYVIKAFYHKEDKAWYVYKNPSEGIIPENEVSYALIRDDIDAHKVGNTNTKFDKIIQY